MKFLVRLEVECEIEGELAEERVGELYANEIGGCILSENVDQTEDWAVITKSVEVVSVENADNAVIK